MTLALDEALATYGAAWVEPDADKRRALLEVCWSDDGHYMDPNGTARGRDALADLISEFQAQVPGARIELTSGASVHNGRIYFNWQMVTADGKVVVEGVDFGRLGKDGRLREIVGFFGPPPGL